MQPKPGQSLAESPGHARLCEEWDTKLNGGLTPRDVTVNSLFRAAWRCKACGHGWITRVSSRTGKRWPTGCPDCARALRNSSRPDRPARGAPFEQRTLRAVFPHLAAEWHPTKNGDRTPDNVTYGCGDKFWWQCSKKREHEWQAPISSRARGEKGHGAGCPYCAKVGWGVSSENSLAVLNPQAAAEWHPTKNGNLKAHEVRAKSDKMVWWLCSEPACAHAWRATPGARTNGGTGCPACAGQAVTDKNSLAARFPDVAAEWDEAANGGVKASEVVPGSNDTRWWRCKECEHKWAAAPNSRTGSGRTGCPACAGQAVTATNNLAARKPEVAAEWDEAANGGLKASEVMPGSSVKRWWGCKACGHKWTATPADRTRGDRPSGCPSCAVRRVADANRRRAAERRAAPGVDPGGPLALSSKDTTGS